MSDPAEAPESVAIEVTVDVRETPALAELIAANDAVIDAHERFRVALEGFTESGAFVPSESQPDATLQRLPHA